MDDYALFYPCYIDHWGAISTVHREVGSRLDGYSITTFSHADDRSSLPFDRTVPVSPDNNWKHLTFAKTYASKYDIVHTGPQTRDLLAGAAKARGARIVHTMHAAPPVDEVIDGNARLIQQADVLTAVSKYVRKWAQQDLGIDAEIHVIPNGVDLDLFNPANAPTEDGVFRFVGSFSRNKHPEFVLELARAMPEYDFELIGDGPEGAELRRQAADCANVEIRTPIADKGVLAREYASATALLVPFEREGFGLVVLEALASGTPVVGLYSGNISNLVDDQSNGFLCSELDIEEWKRALLAVSDTPSLSPRASVAEYAWENVASRYDDLYRSLL